MTRGFKLQQCALRRRRREHGVLFGLVTMEVQRRSACYLVDLLSLLPDTDLIGYGHKPKIRRWGERERLSSHGKPSRAVTVYLPAPPCRHRITLGSLGFHRQLVSMDHKRLDPPPHPPVARYRDMQPCRSSSTSCVVHVSIPAR
jgi:hypothetical protein